MTRYYGGGILLPIESEETMKKTIISIIGIAVMLLAITACRPNYVIVPIPGGGTSSTPSGTPVADLGELKDVLADGGEARLTGTLKLNPTDLVNLSGTINGAGNTIELQTIEPVGDEQAFALILNNVSLKNVNIDARKVATTRAATEPFVILVQGEEESTLENVKITTGGKVAGINVHTATSVTLKNIEFTDKPLKAPINISSSTVTIDGLKAGGSDWYGDKNIIQINGVGGKPYHQPSTVTFESTEGIDGIWMEAVEAEYVNDETISDKDFRHDGQSVVEGLSSDWAIRYSNQPSKKTEGWMFYAPDEDASTFTLNEKAEDPEADLIAMLTAVAESAEARRYSTIKLAKDVEISDTIIVTSTVTLDLNEKTLSNTEPIWVDVEDGNEDRWSIISVRENGDLTITGDGTIDALENDCYAFDVVDGSHLVIENGKFIGNISVVYVYGGSAEIQGGRYSIQQKSDVAGKPYEFVLNLLDKEKRDWPATIVVTGGTFEKFNPADNKAEGENTSFVAEGYASTYNESDKTYTVNKKIGV